MPISSLTVADYYIQTGFQEGIDLVTPLKLQKLLYFAHGWYLALTGEPLLDESLEAWKFGPVVPSVYGEFKSFGNQPISRTSKQFNPEVLQSRDVLAAKPLMDRIWAVYSKYTASQLSALSHESGGPWSQTRALQRGVIADVLIQRWFEQKLKPA